jgi:hypothetical protein
MPSNHRYCRWQELLIYTAEFIFRFAERCSRGHESLSRTFLPTKMVKAVRYPVPTIRQWDMSPVPSPPPTFSLGSTGGASQGPTWAMAPPAKTKVCSYLLLIWNFQKYSLGLGASSIGELGLAVATLIKNWLALATTTIISVSLESQHLPRSLFQ